MPYIIFRKIHPIYCCCWLHIIWKGWQVLIHRQYILCCIGSLLNVCEFHKISFSLRYFRVLLINTTAHSTHYKMHKKQVFFSFLLKCYALDWCNWHYFRYLKRTLSLSPPLTYTDTMNSLLTNKLFNLTGIFYNVI